jgi:ribosomal-protein-serine acetyltransferase
MLLRLQINKELELRTFQVEDAPILFSLTDKNRAYLRQWLPWLDRTKTIQDSAGFINFANQEAQDKVGMTFGIWQNNELVGVCSFQKINKTNKAANIGYWISKDQSGRGLARTVTQKLINYAFNELQLHRIEIRCAKDNIGSQKVAEASGLKYEGLSRDCEWLYDHFVDHKVYSILRTEN